MRAASASSARTRARRPASSSPSSRPRRTAKLAELLPAEASLANPVDMLGSATAASYEAVLPVVLEDPAVDSVIVLFVPPAQAGAEDVAAGIARTLAAESTDKPVLAAILSAEGVPSALRDHPRAGGPLHLSRVGGTRSRPRRRAGGVAAQARGRRPVRRRHRHCRGRACGHPSPRERGRRLAHAGADQSAPGELRPAARRGTARRERRGRRRSCSGARIPDRRQVGGRGRAQDRDRRRRARPGRRGSRPRRGGAHRCLRSSSSRWSRPEWSCSRASSRTRRSARWSRSARAESSPS